MKRLHISENRRFLVWDDGTPFFWLGDTGWELFHRLTLEEAEFYLENRRRQGFSVIQAVALAEFDGLHTPNACDDRPLIDLDPARPNEAYFRHVDRIVALAADKGLIVALVPTWGDKLELLGHGVGPVVFNPANARAYGEWIGRRYRDTWNLIWVNGGDRQGGGPNRPIWEALGAGIKSVDPNHLMTFHPPGGGDGHSSSEWFHDAGWLDFNLAQSGHERRHLPNYQLVEADYQRVPVKPCLDGEPRYEDHAVNWKPAELGYFDEHDVRQAVYWAVFAGGFGVTYGCHPIWQFCSDRHPPIAHARRPWREALDLPGAGQLIHLRRLIESRPMLSRVPAQEIFVDPPAGAAHPRATRGEGYLFVYLPLGGTARLQAGAVAGRALRGWWFNPRDGQSRPFSIEPWSEVKEFHAPGEGWGQDWVLVLDEADPGYAPPGSTPDGSGQVNALRNRSSRET
jgi:hypothetical protein